MNEIRVESWGALQEALFTDSWNPAIQRFRSQFAFRGLSSAAYPLTTTLQRLGGPYGQMETHLLRNFRKYAHGHFIGDDCIWDWLSLAQHHGLPTRLMDWTYSPLVAAHFATTNTAHFHLDGAIWAIHYKRAHERLPLPLRKLLDEEGSDVFTGEMLSTVAGTLRQLAGLANEPFLLFYEPPSMDERIVNQYALFSIMSQAQTTVDDWLRQQPDLWFRIILPASLKWEVRDKLDQANITERVLFPGLDGLTRWLRRHYRPSDARDPAPEDGSAENGA